MENSIVHLLDHVIYFVFFVPFVIIPFLLFNWIRYVWSRRSGSTLSRPFPVITISLFVGPILIVFAIGYLITLVARNEVMTFLSGADDVEVSINGRVVADPAPILKALRSMTWIMAHHSHPTTRLHVVIHGKTGTLALELGRDSDQAREYWVFYPGYLSTQANEIDRIVSSALDSY